MSFYLKGRQDALVHLSLQKQSSVYGKTEKLIAEALRKAKPKTHTGQLAALGLIGAGLSQFIPKKRNSRKTQAYGIRLAPKKKKPSRAEQAIKALGANYLDDKITRSSKTPRHRR